MQKQYEDDELYHHGIIGMKWGSRNGPPYPLKKNVSKQIKKGNNPQYKKDEAYRKEREKLKKGEDVETSGFSLGKKKKKLFDKTTKAQQLTPQEDAIDKVQDMIDENNRYLNTDSFGSKDLSRLTKRYNDESAYNEALARKYKSENDMLINRANKLSRGERKKYEKMVKKYETDAAYNRAVQQQIQSQIDLLRAQQTLKQMTAKPKKEGLIKKGGRAVGDMLGTAAKRVGTEAATIFFGELLNQGLNKFYTSNQRHKNPSENDMPNSFYQYGGGKGKNKDNKKGGGGDNSQDFAKAFADAFKTMNSDNGSSKSSGNAAKNTNFDNNFSKSSNAFNNANARRTYNSGHDYSNSFFNQYGNRDSGGFSRSTVNTGERYVHNWNNDNHNNVFLLEDKGGK